MVKRRSVRTMCPMPHRMIYPKAVHARMAIGMSRRRAHLDDTASIRDTASRRVIEDIKGKSFTFSYHHRVSAWLQRPRFQQPPVLHLYSQADLQVPLFGAAGRAVAVGHNQSRVLRLEGTYYRTRGSVSPSALPSSLDP